jgi:hypothetical protein
MHEYLFEYMGSLVITYALVFTHENPFIVGLAHTAVLYLAKQQSLKGHFTPLSVIVDLLLRKMDIMNGITLIGVHVLAAVSVVLIYVPLYKGS